MIKSRKPHISLEKCARICLLVEQSFSMRKIAKIEGIGHMSVVRIIKKKEETGSLNNIVN